MRLRAFYAFGKLRAAWLSRHGGLLGLVSPLVACMICCAAVPLRAQRSPAVDNRFRQASEAMRRGSLEEAGDGFAAVTKAAPTFAEAHLNLGLVREDQGRHEEAIASLQKALSLKPRLRGHVEIHRHSYRDAIWFVLQDHSSGRSHRLTPAAYAFMGLMDGKRSVQNLWDICNEHSGTDAPTQDDVVIRGRYRRLAAMALTRRKQL